MNDQPGASLAGKSVLITGAAGFIGSNLTRRLVTLGANVSALVQYQSEIANVRLSSVWRKLDVIEGDIRNQDSLAAIGGRHFDVVLHLAAYNHVGHSFTHVGEVMDVNGKGTANLLEALKDYGRFVYTSSSEVYGHQASVPFVETMQPFPISPYAVGKYSGELYARFKQHMGKLPIVIVRPFNVFGPYQSTKAVIPELIIKCLNGEPIITTEGKQTREFNFVENIVDGFLLAATKPGIEGEILNVAEGHEIAIAELARMIHRLTESKSDLRIGALPYRPTEIWRMYADASKAQRMLGWTPSVLFEEGMKRTVNWYRRFVKEFDDPNSPLNKL